MRINPTRRFRANIVGEQHQAQHAAKECSTSPGAAAPPQRNDNFDPIGPDGASLLRRLVFVPTEKSQWDTPETPLAVQPTWTADFPNSTHFSPLFSSDGTFIVAKKKDEAALYTFRAATGDVAHNKTFSRRIYKTLVHLNNESLIALDGATFRCLDTATGEQRWENTFEPGNICETTLSLDGGSLAVNARWTLQVLDASTGKKQCEKIFQKQLIGIDFSPNGASLVARDGKTAYCLDAKTGKRKWKRVADFWDSPTWSSDSKYVAMFARLKGQECVLLLDAITGKIKWVEYGGQTSHRFSPDGASLITLNGAMARNLDVVAKRTTWQKTFRSQMSILNFSCDGVLCSDLDKTTLLSLDPVTGKSKWATSFKQGLYHSPSVSPNGALIAVELADTRTAELLDAATGKKNWGQTFETQITDIVFSPSSDSLLVATRNKIFLFSVHKPKSNTALWGNLASEQKEGETWVGDVQLSGRSY